MSGDMSIEMWLPGKTQPFDLVSLGADGREGGDGTNRDIMNER